MVQAINYNSITSISPDINSKFELIAIAAHVAKKNQIYFTTNTEDKKTKMTIKALNQIEANMIDIESVKQQLILKEHFVISEKTILSHDNDEISEEESDNFEAAFKEAFENTDNENISFEDEEEFEEEFELEDEE
jgi:DNA-directed RNA polymerase subunit K/omega